LPARAPWEIAAELGCMAKEYQERAAQIMGRELLHINNNDVN